MRPSSPARYLAPTALVLCTLVIAIVVSSSSGGSHHPVPPAAGQAGKPRKHRRTYVVHHGDSLSRVALKTGISVARLEELNPRLDPNALRPGQRVKLVQ